MFTIHKCINVPIRRGKKHIYIFMAHVYRRILIVIRVYLFFSHRTTACVYQPLKLVTPRKIFPSTTTRRGALSDDLLFWKSLSKRRDEGKKISPKINTRGSRDTKIFPPHRDSLRCKETPRHHTSSCVYRVANVKEN